MVQPGVNKPCSSASWIMRNPIRSFTEPPGLKNSTFTSEIAPKNRLSIKSYFVRNQTQFHHNIQISHFRPASLGILLSLTKGVEPMVCKIFEYTLFSFPLQKKPKSDCT